MKTYVRLFGPDLKSAIERLEDLVIIHDELVQHKSYLPLLESSQDEDHLKILQQGHLLIGSYDFIFSWKQVPSSEEIDDLVAEIDASFKDLAVHYTIVTVPDEKTSPETYLKLPNEWNLKDIEAISYLTVYGPPLLEILKKLEDISDVIVKEGKLPLMGGSKVIGRFDFAFAWKEKPSPPQILRLTTLLDDTFQEKNALYSIDTVTP